MKPNLKTPPIFILLILGLAFTFCSSALIAQAQIQVTAADPPSAAQGTVNLNVKVTGKGFKSGAKAKWFITGTTDPGGVQVNSTTFVNSAELTANITIADTAVIANFDIAVANPDGRGGKGTELFAVVPQGSSPKVCSANVVLTFGDRFDDKVQSTIKNLNTGDRSYSGGSINCEGRFIYIFDHAVHFDLNSPVGSNPPLGVFDGVPNIGIEVADPPGSSGSLLLMEPLPASYFAYKVQFNVVNGGNRYFVQFGEKYPGTSVPDVTLSGSQPPRIWTIETNTTTGDVANIVICPANGACKKPGGGLYHAAFRITLTEQ